jgi:hypothetical protein
VACGWRHAFLLLAAVEKTREQEQQREHEGKLGVRAGLKAELDRSVHEPNDTSDKPDPRSLLHRFVLDGADGPLGSNCYPCVRPSEFEWETTPALVQPARRFCFCL